MPDQRTERVGAAAPLGEWVEGSENPRPQQALRGDVAFALAAAASVDCAGVSPSLAVCSRF
ncbi:MAG: hypothetical protein AUH41_03485 [Gemmatimonadetes bacterium 13_1_40CM_66_11]|nr:MAG: hypothetical protein AUH41_03485 [Gemmatimonadetes bacterium 13_1_40CM_66_11]